MALRLACLELISARSQHVAASTCATFNLCQHLSSSSGAPEPTATSDRAASSSGASSSSPSAIEGKGFVSRGSPEYAALLEQRKIWRKNVNHLLGQWRREMVQQVKLAREENQSQRPISASPKAAPARVRASRELQLEVREAQVEVDKAQLALQNARTFEARQTSTDRMKERRRQALLEASRTWITRETLAERVNQALDSPRPFGFVANVVTKPFPTKPRSSS